MTVMDNPWAALWQSYLRKSVTPDALCPVTQSELTEGPTLKESVTCTPLNSTATVAVDHLHFLSSISGRSRFQLTAGSSNSQIL